MVSFYQLLFFLLLGISIIVLFTARYKIHPFFALLVASLVVGLGAGLNVKEIIEFMKEGFGNIMRSLGFIIVLGTTLGVMLEHSGSTRVMANSILKIVGKKRSTLAMSVTGFIVGLPIFCDSGFIVLSGLNKSLAKQTGVRVIVMAVSLATGLYAVHCLIPPHPGAAAAAGIIGVDFGKLIIVGIIVAIPAMLVGYFWAVTRGNKIELLPGEDEEHSNSHVEVNDQLPSTLNAFLPIVVPIVLIAVASFLSTSSWSKNGLYVALSFLGDPVAALSIGILLSINSIRKSKRGINAQLREAVEKAGILVIIGAGGAFGAVLAATKIGQHFSETLPLENLGILFPFLVTFVLKTAQGSSTVAIITASSIVLPLLPALGLDSSQGRLLCVLAMGGGSMMISHANDAYFWVISKFEGIPMKSMLEVYSVASILMGLITLLMVYILSLVL